MNKLGLKRRDFLKGVGAAAAALPLMSALDAKAQQGQFPKRLLIVFSANGTAYENWVPSGTETAFTLSRILAPLEPHKGDIVVLDNVKNEAAHHGPGDGHMTGMGCLLTATELLPGTQFSCGGTDPCSGWGGGISVDQHIANALYEALPTDARPKFKSLELAVQAGGADIWSRMCYAGSDQPLAPMEDPAQVWERVFADLNVNTEDLDRLRAQRRSVLDYVGGRLTRLRGRLGGEDREKLDAHLQAVREIEMQLASGGLLGGCTQPAEPGSIDFRNNDNFPAVLKLQTDLTVRALACNLTQVATIQWSRSVSGTRHTWAGVSEGHHDLSHEGDSNADAIEKITKINVWFAEQFAYLLAQLKSVREGDGTLLDNTLVLWGNELGRGNSHSRTRVPFVLAGRAGGALEAGRFLRYDDDSHSNLLVSVCQLMGVQAETFGNPEYCQGPLRVLT
jgi:hypothetical protein